MTDHGDLDLLDRRLQEYGSRWRAAMPAPVEPQTIETRRNRSTRRWLVPVAAAAVVAVIIGVTFAMTSGDEQNSAPTDVTPTDRAVPWAPLPAGGAGLSAYRPRSLYQDVTVTGDLHLDRKPGGNVDFEVTLTSPTDLPLAPCPDYAIWIGPWQAVYALNCAAVPFHDDQARPYLPARTPVTFAMSAADRFPPGLVGVEGVLTAWELFVPGRPSLMGTLDNNDSVLDTGTITGTVTMDGGPPPGQSVIVTSGTVTLTGAAGGTYTAQIGPGGAYDIAVPAGAYDLTVSTPQWNDGSPFRDGMIGVTGGAVVQGNVSLPMK